MLIHRQKQHDGAIQPSNDYSLQTHENSLRSVLTAMFHSIWAPLAVATSSGTKPRTTTNLCEKPIGPSDVNRTQFRRTLDGCLVQNPVLVGSGKHLNE